jgi:hypothetical protein
MPDMKALSAAITRKKKLGIFYITQRSYGQHIRGVNQDLRRLGNDSLGQLPLLGLDCVPDGGEVGLVVAGPQLRPKDDVLELRAVGDLEASCVSFAGFLKVSRDRTYASAFI